MIAMPFTLLVVGVLMQQSTPEQLNLTTLQYQWPLAAYLLLFAAAGLLTSNISRHARYVVAVGTPILAAVLLYYNGLLGWPGWLGVTAVYFVPLTAIGFCIGFAFVLARQGRSLLALLPLAVAGIFIAWQVSLAGGYTSIIDYPYQGTGLFVVLPLIGGLLLALSLTSRQKRRTGYISLWLLFAGTIGLAAYMNLMEGITYAFVAPDRMFGPYAGVRVTEARIEAVVATSIYAAGSLLLLVLPFGLGKRRGHRQTQALTQTAGLEQSEQSAQTVKMDQTHRNMAERVV